MLNKVLKVIGLGIGIWSLSLIWLNLNQRLTSPLGWGLMLGLLLLVVLLYSVNLHPDSRQLPQKPEKDAGSIHSSPTHPVHRINGPTFHSQPTRPTRRLSCQ